MNNKIFKFANGYTIALRREFSPGLIDALADGWKEQNPPPEPPTKTVKVKGGTRELPQPNDSDYLADVQTWQNMLAAYRNEIAFDLALDPASIDKAMIAQAREKLAELGGTGTKNDVMLYLSLVADPGYGDTGDPDYRVSELDELMRFIREERGPSGALIEHLLKTRFQDGNLEQKT